MSKMIDKQITAAEKAIEKYNKSIDRYKSIIEKREIILSKVTPDYKSYNNAWAFGKDFGEKYIDIFYSYKDANERLNDAIKNKNYEEARLENLLKEKNNKIENKKSFIDATQSLVDMFEKHLAVYKEKYFNECEKSFNNFYVATMKLISWAQEIIDKSKHTLPWIFHQGRRVDRVLDNDCHYDYNTHAYMWKDWKKGWTAFTDEQMECIRDLRKAQQIIGANCHMFDSKEAYVKYRMDGVKMDWDSKVRLFADKCKKFNIDIENVEFNFDETYLKGGGCSFYLTDGGPYRIYGRFIYAAEYSDKVSPHIRFIVTKKNA